ncbi:hypothetical protein [Kitasatospora sp. KL5]|uniref:hypothetical protein n=1 Tax=Kitasatospora sp. KL5 TaxID=3425125 RepID=UPI003D6EF74A
MLRNSAVSILAALLLSVVPTTAHARDSAATSHVRTRLLNPADTVQIPIGTPIALLFVAAALIFLPSTFDIPG